MSEALLADAADVATWAGLALTALGGLVAGGKACAAWVATLIEARMADLRARATAAEERADRAEAEADRLCDALHAVETALAVADARRAALDDAAHGVRTPPPL